MHMARHEAVAGHSDPPGQRPPAANISPLCSAEYTIYNDSNTNFTSKYKPNFYYFCYYINNK